MCVCVLWIAWTVIDFEDDRNPHCNFHGKGHNFTYTYSNLMDRTYVQSCL